MMLNSLSPTTTFRRLYERPFEREQAKLLHEELDRCHGSCVLRWPEPQRIIDGALEFYDGIRFWLGDRVIMPNHVHAIIQPFEGLELEELLGSIKKWTSRRIGEWLASSQSGERQPDIHMRPSVFWQRESYDRIIRDVEELRIFNRYIANNPQAARCREGEFRYQKSVDWVTSPT